MHLYRINGAKQGHCLEIFVSICIKQGLGVFALQNLDHHHQKHEHERGKPSKVEFNRTVEEKHPGNPVL